MEKADQKAPKQNNIISIASHEESLSDEWRFSSRQAARMI